LRTRLEARLGEIEEATLARISAISDPGEISDPAYVDGLHRAIAAALEYALDAIEEGPRHEAPIPVDLLAQARLAARVGVPLDAVLRRYFAGYALLGDLLIDESRDLGLSLEEVSEVHSANAGLFDRLIAAVGAEHAREAGKSSSKPSSTTRRLALVRRLLDGERIDSSGLAYELDARHLGLVAEGPGVEGLLRSLAAALDRRLLLVRSDQDTAWAWLGGSRLDPAQASAFLPSALPRGTALALGEPGEGLAGWRLTHRQAAAALLVARRRGRPVRYATVALLAAALRDDLLATSLRRLYLEPLERQRDRGETAKKTLRAYFDSDRNASAAAAALGVNRNTVADRLRVIEGMIARPLSSCAPELEAALRLAESGAPSSS
jgi:hypothetical protein